MNTHAVSRQITPWYREPWPWILIGLPAAAVVAGIITLVIAIQHQDGLVAEDYYKQGLAINRVLEREATAAHLGLKADLMFASEKVRVRLDGQSRSQTLVMRFLHIVDANEDREVLLSAIAPGFFEGHMPQLSGARWRIQLEDDQATWRLSGVWKTGEPNLSLVASTAAAEKEPRQ